MQQQQQLSAARRDDYDLEDRRRKNHKRQRDASEYPQIPSPAASHASSGTGGTGSSRHGQQHGHRQQHQQHQEQHPQKSLSHQQIPRKLKRPHEDHQSQSQQRYRDNNNRPSESQQRQRHHQEHPRDQQHQHHKQHPQDRYRREESSLNNRKRSSESSSSLKHPNRPMHHDRPIYTEATPKSKNKTAPRESFHASSTTSSTNRSNNSNPSQPKKNDQVEHLIHPKLVGRFIPRKSANTSAATSGTGTGSLIPRKNSTGTGSGSLIQKSVSECVPATVSQHFSATTKQSTAGGVSSKMHANTGSTGTGTGCRDRSEHQYHYHQAHAPPLSEGGTTPLTEASTTSGSVSGSGVFAFGSVESMPTSTTATTNRWLHSHEPPVKEIPMVVCQSQTKPTATGTASIQTGTNNSSTNSNSSDDTMKGKKKRRDDGSGTKESTVSTNSDDQQKQSQQMLLKLQQIQVGSRVAVYWDGDDEFFPGTVTKERNALTHRKRFFLKYDDGDREWIDFSRHKFRVLKDKKKQTVFDDANDNENDDDDGDSTTQSEQKGRRKVKKNVKGKSATVQQNVRVDDNGIDRSCSSDGRKMKREAEEKSSTALMAKSDSVAPVVKQNAQVSSERKRKIKAKAGGKPANVHKGESNLFVGNVDDNWVASGFQRSTDDSSDDSDTDEEEIMLWAEKMFGVTPQRPIARAKAKVEPEFNWDDYADVRIPISEAVKMGRRRNRDQGSMETSAPKIKRCKVADMDAATEKAAIDAEEEENKRKKQEKRALTADEIRSILGEDSRECDENTNWVRRSVRQPSKSIVNSPQVKALFEKLRMNDTDMVVLKMKKYLNDPNTPSVAIDAVLDVLEENTNCEALYIQNFNEGMRDEQVLHLLKVLQRPSCKIWCMNIGETYKVKSETWEIFTNGLRDTKITHMYASEHTIDAEFKDSIRSTIRSNRKKHTMHIDPDNLDTIVQCTHCWWNPINAKALRPYLKTRGCEYLLHDAEAQGLPGTMSADKVL